MTTWTDDEIGGAVWSDDEDPSPGERISFADFGAVGDYNPSTGAGTDDTAAIQAAIAYAKSLYDSNYADGPILIGGVGISGGNIFKVTSPLFFGAKETISEDRIVHYRGEGAIIYVAHSAFGVDCTGIRDSSIDDLTIVGDANVSPSAGLVVARREHDVGADGHRNVFKNLRVSGTFTIAGVVTYASESNTWYGCKVSVNEAVACFISTDCGTYWNGTSFVSITFPNLDTSNPPTTGESNTNNHFHGLWLSHTNAASTIGVCGLQLIGANKNNFHGLFINVADSDLNNILLHKSSGGANPIQNKIFGYNPHTASGAVGILAKAVISGLELHGNTNAAAASTVDFRSESGIGTCNDVHISMHKIEVNSNYTGTNIFQVSSSFTSTGTIEGLLLYENGATLSIGSNAANQRLFQFNVTLGIFKRARDSLNVTPVSTSGTGEDNLMTYSITGSANLMGVAGRKMRVRAAGTKTGSAGNKTVTFYIGTSSWEAFPAANDTHSWKIEAEVVTTASNAQWVSVKGYQNGDLVYSSEGATALDMTSTQVMKVTGTCADGADSVTQTIFDVEIN